MSLVYLAGATWSACVIAGFAYLIRDMIKNRSDIGEVWGALFGVFPAALLALAPWPLIIGTASQ